MRDNEQTRQLICRMTGIPLTTQIDRNGILWALGVALLDLKLEVRVIRFVLLIVLVSLFAVIFSISWEGP